jgi:beta-lactamase superfamily II metal-dependent hydrolase
MLGRLALRVFDVEHGACAILVSPTGERIAMIDCGHNATSGWRPSTYIRHTLNRTHLDYLFVTNADQDHLSDLDGLWRYGISVGVLHRNPSPDASVLRAIKSAQGELTNDIERFLQIHQEFVHPVAIPFDQGMGGVTCSAFWNVFPAFADTNNLSQAVFIKYGAFKMLFPGGLEEEGWKGLLRNPSFVSELAGTSVLVASHHGRLSGYCQEIFEHFMPRVVVVSDKPIVHSTQEIVPDYRAVVNPAGVVVTNQGRPRHVLTTRRDGDVGLSVDAAGNFWITTGDASAWAA